MAYSSIVGADQAPVQSSGRDSDALGPSDNSDSGSDAQGTAEIHGDSDAGGTGERGAVYGPDAAEGRDVMPDRVVRIGDDMNGLPEADPDSAGFTDLGADDEVEGGDEESES